MSSTNDGAAQDCEDMQKAFQEFMLGGKTTATTVSSPLPTSSAPSPHSMNRRHNDSTEQRRKIKQRRSIFVRHRSALQAFHSVLIDDWFHADDQLGRVVDSIANLRHRIWITSGRLISLKDDTEPFSSTRAGTGKSIKLSSWKNYGYRGSMSSSSSSSLSSLLKFDQNQNQNHQQVSHQNNDLELALSHSILMHENMMVACRKQLLPLLHQAQETLGRRLEDFMIVVETAVATLADAIEEDTDDDEDSDDEGWMTRMQNELQKCQELYRATAEEVYRKQEMVQVCILDTVHDGLLQNTNDSSTSENRTKKNPQASANRCSSQWSRQTKASALYKYQDMLDRIVQEKKRRDDEVNDNGL